MQIAFICLGTKFLGAQTSAGSGANACDPLEQETNTKDQFAYADE